MHPTEPIEHFNSFEQILVEKAQNRLSQVLSILGSIELIQNMTQTRDKKNKVLLMILPYGYVMMMWIVLQMKFKWLENIAEA